MSQTWPSAPTVPISLAYYCLIPHPRAPRVLILPGERGWTLPWWPYEGDERPFWQAIDGVGRALRGRFGLDAPTLRCLHVGRDPRQGWLEYVYESEPAPPAWALPPGGRWLGHGDLDGLALGSVDEFPVHSRR